MFIVKCILIIITVEHRTSLSLSCPVFGNQGFLPFFLPYKKQSGHS